MLLPFAAIIIKLLCRPYCGIPPFLISIGKRPRAAFLYYKIVSWLLFCHLDKHLNRYNLGERGLILIPSPWEESLVGRRSWQWEVSGTHHRITDGNQRMTNTLLSSLSPSYTVQNPAPESSAAHGG